MKTIPFNPKNKIHLKGFEKWLKKMTKYFKDNSMPTLVIKKEDFEKLKYIVKIKK